MKLSFVCLSVYPVAATGLLLWAQRAEDIGRLLHGWRAGGQQQPLHNGGECGQCHVARRRRKLNIDLSRISQSAVFDALIARGVLSRGLRTAIDQCYELWFILVPDPIRYPGSAPVGNSALLAQWSASSRQTLRWKRRLVVRGQNVHTTALRQPARSLLCRPMVIDIHVTSGYFLLNVLSVCILSWLPAKAQSCDWKMGLSSINLKWKNAEHESQQKVLSVWCTCI